MRPRCADRPNRAKTSMSLMSMNDSAGTRDTISLHQQRQPVGVVDHAFEPDTCRAANSTPPWAIESESLLGKEKIRHRNVSVSPAQRQAEQTVFLRAFALDLVDTFAARANNRRR